MKKLILLASIFLVTALSGCKKFLDIQPKFKFSESLAINSYSDLQKTTTGAFSALQSGNLYGGGFIVNDELMADWIKTGSISDFSLNQLVSRQLNAFNSVSTGVWNDAYKTINICNIVLYNLPKFENEDPAGTKVTKGECLFIRAIMHYELLRRFAQASGYTANDAHLGVPIRLTPGNAEEGQDTKRSTVAEVYAQIQSDLEQAATLLPAAANARASQYAAYAFLAKINFTQNKFDKAIEWSEKIPVNVFVLKDSVNSVFSTGEGLPNAENIFQVDNNLNDRSNDVLHERFSDKASASSTLPLYIMNPGYFTSLLATQYSLGDKRALILFKKFATNWLCRKYTFNLSMNTPVLRYSELLLIHAESLAETGGSDADVRKDYNQLRVRAGLLADNSTSGKAALIAAVRQERDMELAMEGDRLFEVRRRKAQYFSAAGTFNWDEPRLIYPIPQQEVDQNKNMVQNPGY
ncbi:MAG: RagB/SusD family nutrient uptake outer membrane protein [Chitinophagales bacterium]